MEHNNGNNGPMDLQFDEDMCERYLLGELSESDQERFETAYFSDDVLFDRFMAVKNELLDLYSRGELEPDKQDQVRRHFSATGPRSKQLADSRQFIDAVTSLSVERDHKAAAPEPVPDRQPFFSFLKFSSLVWATAAALLFTVVGIWWLSTHPPETDIAGLQPSPSSDSSLEISIPTPSGIEEKKDVEIETGIGDVSPSGPPGNRPRLKDGPTRPPSRAVTQTQPGSRANGLQARLLLAAVVTRDIGDANTLRIYSDTRGVSIELTPPGGAYKTYNAVINTVGGEAHWQTNRVRRVGKNLTLQVDPRALKQSDYLLTLSGVTPAGGSETVAEYYFHVVRDSQKTPSSVSPK
jgi:hypothetical protein